MRAADGIEAGSGIEPASVLEAGQVVEEALVAGIFQLRPKLLRFRLGDFRAPLEGLLLVLDGGILSQQKRMAWCTR